MAAPATTTQIPAKGGESKSSKKKKAAKAVGNAVEAPAAPAPVTEATESNAGDAASENATIKELQRKIRNINKRITSATSNVDQVMKEFPEKTLEELVALRKINADQRVQFDKLPELQGSKDLLVDKLNMCQKLEDEFKAKLATERGELEKSLLESALKEKEAAVAEAKKEALAKVEEEQLSAFLLISQFLRLAAIRRGEEDADRELPENVALEGLLAQLYAGDNTAVVAMKNIIQGSSENVFSIDGKAVDITFEQIREAITAQQFYSFAMENETTINEEVIESDPTITHAGLTEIGDSTVAVLTNGHSESFAAEEPPKSAPQSSNVGEGGNAVAETSWDASNDLSSSQEGWVNVSSDVVQADTGSTTTPAPTANEQSWAEDPPDSPAVEATPVNSNNDGFHEVQRNKGANRGDGHGHRGHNDRGGRGRGGHRGDGRGRGRGGAHRGNGEPRRRGGRPGGFTDEVTTTT